MEPAEDGAGLIEFALQCGEASLELFLAKLGDHFALGDALAFLDGKLHQQAWDLERQFHAARGLGDAGEDAGADVAAGGDDHRFDWADRLGPFDGCGGAAEGGGENREGEERRLHVTCRSGGSLSRGYCPCAKVDFW